MPGLNLTKTYETGSLRWVGKTFNGCRPKDLVIGGKSIDVIAKSINYKAFKIRKFDIKNAFVAFNGLNIFYIYANPNYSDYRKAFQAVVEKIPVNYHIDHILGRSLARHFGFSYVLLCMIPKRVNLKHGRIEKIRRKKSTSGAPEVCYADDRIYDKILSRNPEARRSPNQLLGGYDPKSVPSYELTLKQKGLWNVAFGFDQVNTDCLLNKISEIDSY